MGYHLSRRRFIKRSGVLCTASFLPLTTFGHERASKYKMGLQLFSIRDAMDKDVMGSLALVRSLGYEDLEIYGYDGENDSYYGYRPADFKKILEDLELTTSSGHYGLHDYFEQPESVMMRYLDQCIQGALALGQSYITWPWLHPDSRTLENFKKLAEKLNRIGEKVNKAGLGFAYHNHDFEFLEHDGETGYDIILNQTDPALVKLQLDMYWAEHSSRLSIKELVVNNPDRYVMWHIKDMDKLTRDYTELGNGSIDYTSILPDVVPLSSGLQYYYLEQGGNFTHNSLQSISDSAAYFKKNLKKYL